MIDINELGVLVAFRVITFIVSKGGLTFREIVIVKIDRGRTETNLCFISS
jgi:hypothetical protein